MSGTPKKKHISTLTLTPITTAVVLAISSQASFAAPPIINTADRSTTLTPGAMTDGDSQHINNSGQINVTGTGSEQGIQVVIGGNSNITIENTGNINIDASSSINLSQGIYANGGKTSVTNNASVKAVSSTDGTANAIQAFSTGSGAAGGTTIVSHGDLTASDTAIYGQASGNDTLLSVTVSGKIESGMSKIGLRDAIELYASGTNSNVFVDFQSGSIETFNTAGATSAARGISANSASGKIDIITGADTTIKTGSNQSHGILTTTGTGGGATVINSKSNITTTGIAAGGIHANSNTGDILITSTGDIKTLGTGSVTSVNPSASSNDEAHGIVGVSSGAGNIVIDASGSIETNGYDASGVRGYGLGSGDVTLTYSGPSIVTKGNNGDGLYAQTTGTGNVSVTSTGGTITTSGGGTTTGSAAHGIVAIATSGNSKVENASTIATGLSATSHGITARTTTGTVKVTNTGNISTQGLSSHGIHASGTGTTNTEGQLQVNSSGKINTSGKGAIAIYANTSGSTASVTTNGENTATGEYGSGVVAMGGLAGAIINLDPNAITQGGWQADATSNYGGLSASGTNGNGVYNSDGGFLNIDTFLNKGDEATQSDLLVVDNTTLSGSATGININRVGNKAELTTGNGIKVVEVLGTSAAGSFSLANRALSGPYEYLLYQGSVINNPANQSWYLRNVTEDGKPIYRAEVGSYLGNQTAAVGMFMHTLHDRLGEPQFTEAYKADGNTPSVWMRVVTNKTDSEAGSGTLDQSTDTNLVHLGGEIARWENDTNRLHFGLMGGYGESKTDTTANPTGRSSEGKVEGYNFGVYATWYGNKDLPTGPYVDGWLQYGAFKNKVNAPDTASEEYDSDVFTASIEAGYTFIMQDRETRQWMFEPQVQIAYNQYNSDDHTDATGMRISGNDASGLITRVGARAYSRTKTGNGIQPFVEANWWHSEANNSLDFDGISISDDTPADRFELKLGLQGEIAKNWQAWGHIGAQTGDNSYSRYEGMVGIKHIF